MVNNITSHNNNNLSSVKPQTVVVNNMNLSFDRGVVCIVVVGYIVDRYSFRGVIAVFHIVVVAILLTITV
jgi:hypothetical protein